MASRKIEDLTSAMVGMARVHVQLCEARGIQILIYCTLRSNAEQDALYEIGRSKPGKILTYAKAGQSAHNPDSTNKSSAYDFCPLLYGKPIWNGKDPVWAIAGACAEEAGLVWSGRWRGKMTELAHAQDPNWKKL